VSTEEDRLARRLQTFAAAVQAFGEAVRGVSEAFREFAHVLILAGALTKREARRIVRDWARFNRRPPLIYNGRKARR
jgi:hypothetical protein